MTKQARRLPRGLKKKLEASLASLSPREAGRLWLIYLHDALNKGLSAKSYPATEELEAAWEGRLDEAKRAGAAAYNAEVARYNGYHFLTFVAANAHDLIQAELWRLGFLVLAAITRVDKLLHADAVSQLAARALDELLNVTPRPVSHADYDRMMHWSKTDNLVDLEAAATDIADELFKPAYPTFTIDEDMSVKAFWEAHKDRFEAEHLWEVKPEDLRRVYADVAGDRLLKTVFAGDRSRLEFWVEHDFWTHPADPERFNEIEAQTKARLVAMVEAGELVGGRGVYFAALYAPVLICAGKLPAWAALRTIWEDWLADRGIFERSAFPRIDTKSPDGVADLQDLEGPIVGDRLTALVADFLKECRSRPWGKTIAKKVDVAALAGWLVARETPLTILDAPDLGLVDWETFRTHEGDERKEWEPIDLASWGSLKAKAEALGLPIGFDDWEAMVEPPFLNESYYPVAHPENRRSDLARVVGLLNSLRASQRAFTYREHKAGQLSLRDLLGVEFFTPLEDAVKTMGDAFGQVATVRKTLATIETKYFDGLSVLHREPAERLSTLEEAMSAAEEDLAQWLDRLSTWPWGVDVSSLRLVKGSADDDRAAQLVAQVEAMALLPMVRDTVDIDLGDGPKPATQFRKEVGL